MADGWLSSLLGIHRLKDADGNALPQRSTLKILGGDISDDESGKQTVLDVTGAGVPGWYADAPPLSAHACDDEMQGASIAPKWTELDPGNIAAWSMDTVRKQMKCVITSNGSNRMAAQYQAIPASEFTIYGRCNLRVGALPSTDTVSFLAGIGVGDSVGGGWQAVGLLRNTNPVNSYSTSSRWAGTSTLSEANDRIYTGPYFRIRLNVAAVVCEVSVDGQDWFIATDRALAFTPNVLGLHVACFGATASKVAEARWSFFRCDSGAGKSAYGATELGRYVG